MHTAPLPVKGSVKRYELAQWLWTYRHKMGKTEAYEAWKVDRKTRADFLRFMRKDAKEAQVV